MRAHKPTGLKIIVIFEFVVQLNPGWRQNLHTVPDRKATTNVYMYVPPPVSMHVPTPGSMYLRQCPRTYARVHVPTPVSTYLRQGPRTYASVYACTYARVHVPTPGSMYLRQCPRTYARVHVPTPGSMYLCQCHTACVQYKCTTPVYSQSS